MKVSVLYGSLACNVFLQQFTHTRNGSKTIKNKLILEELKSVKLALFKC